MIFLLAFAAWIVVALVFVMPRAAAAILAGVVIITGERLMHRRLLYALRKAIAAWRAYRQETDWWDL